MATDSPHSVPSYLFYPQFQTKAGCCKYVHNDIACSCAYDLESSGFFTIWLGLHCHSLHLSVLYIFHLILLTMYVKFFDYLIFKVRQILTHFSFVEFFHENIPLPFWVLFTLLKASYHSVEVLQHHTPPITILLQQSDGNIKTTTYMLKPEHASLTCVGISKGADLSIAVAVDVSPLR